MPMKSEESRYSRQTVMPEVGAVGQERLARATVAVVGAGGLGSAVAETLCRAGVGRILLIDPDAVELSNLQRQALYEEADIGRPKAEAAAMHLRRIDARARIEVRVASVGTEVGAGGSFLDDVDLVLDCTDNIEARLLLNRLALDHRTPCVFCMVQGTSGMLYVADTQSGRACFSCVFGKKHPFQQPAVTGVLGAAVRFAAALQAAEAMKLLLGHPPTVGLVVFDVWRPRVETFPVARDPVCPTCGTPPPPSTRFRT